MASESNRSKSSLDATRRSQAIDVIEEHLDSVDANQLVAKLREAGWIIVRHDAIKLAQAHARDELRPANDNKPRSPMTNGGGGMGTTV